MPELLSKEKLPPTFKVTPAREVGRGKFDALALLLTPVLKANRLASEPGALPWVEKEAALEDHYVSRQTGLGLNDENGVRAWAGCQYEVRVDTG